MSLSLRAANLLFKNAYWLYEPLYRSFKAWQDRDVMGLMRRFISPGDVVLDIGANVGVYARYLSSLVGDKGHVHCFEPDADNFRHLADAVRGLSNVTPNHAAAGAADGTIDLYLSPQLGVDHRTYAHSESDVKVTVPVKSIDGYISGRFPISAVKMDVQGFEMSVLDGMEKTIAANPGIVFFMELWPYGLKAAGHSAEVMMRRLQSLGFSVSMISTRGLEPLTTEAAAALPIGPDKFWNVLVKRPADR